MLQSDRFIKKQLFSTKSKIYTIKGFKVLVSGSQGADLSDADLKGADLTNTIINRTTKLNQKWRKVWEIVNQVLVKDQDLNGTDLSYVDLIGANLNGVDLSYVDLIGANLRDSSLI